MDQKTETVFITFGDNNSDYIILVGLCEELNVILYKVL